MSQGSSLACVSHLVLWKSLPTLLSTVFLPTKPLAVGSISWTTSSLLLSPWMKTKPCKVTSWACLVWSPCFQLHLTPVISWLLSSGHSGFLQNSHGHQAGPDKSLCTLSPLNHETPTHSTDLGSEVKQDFLTSLVPHYPYPWCKFSRHHIWAFMAPYTVLGCIMWLSDPCLSPSGDWESRTLTVSTQDIA